MEPGMRRLIVTEFITLDGIVDSPGGGDHPQAGWTFKEVEFDESATESRGREREEAGAYLRGGRPEEKSAPGCPPWTGRSAGSTGWPGTGSPATMGAAAQG